MEATIGYIRKETFIQRLVGRKTFWGLVCTLLFAYPIYRSMNRTLSPELPVYSSLPSFSFTNDFGKAFGSIQLKGKIYFVSFTNADYINSHPKVMKTLRVIQKRMRGVRNEASHISITTKPTVDNDKVLHVLARKLQANPFYWSFLTGENSVDFINQNFKPLMVEQNLIKKDASIDDLVNLNKIVLVDRIGQVRGFYSMDKHSVNTLMINVGLLMNRKNQK
jgi:protein SCO1